MSEICFGDVLYIKGRIGWQALGKDEYLSSGEYFLVTGVDITNQNRINFDQCYYVTKERYEMDPNIQLRNGDIIVTKDGTIGKIGVIENLEKPATLNSHLFLIRNLRPDVLDNGFLFYVLRSDYFQKFATNNSSGSNVLGFTQENIQKFVIDLPSLLEQRRIASILEDLDNKIRNNSAICADLEGIAKLLYHYWFVQFDFPDKNGKPHKSSGGKMVWNEELKREVPEGWEVKPLVSLIAESKNGDWGNETPKRKDDIRVKCFRGADFASITDDYLVTAPVRYISAKNIDRLLSDGDLVTEISGGSPTQATGRVGYINQRFLDRNGGRMVCSNFCKAFTPKKKEYQYWLYQTWKTFYDSGVMFNYESKTTGIKNLMFDEFIEWIYVPFPTNDLLEKYQNICSQYYNLIQDKFIESAELASLRDFLLPMLMNGQVKVRKGEA